jgi:hypothetical protein
MATVKGVIFANRQAFDGVQTSVFNYLLAQDTDGKIDRTVVKQWSLGIDSTDDTKVLMLVDERVMDFPWNPHAVVDINTDDPKWFPQDETP